jgi:benzoyl-CoA reductase/2-hydroxyglutaryl-CoA dehydratase subunit BcrC/BadD/HgdB
MGKVCPYLEASDMIVGENTCDGKKKAYESFGSLVSNLYVMDIPQMKSGQGRALLKAEYQRFKEAVEKLTGVTIDGTRLKQAIEIVNNKRKTFQAAPGRPGTDFRAGRSLGQSGLFLRQPTALHGLRQQDLR